MTPLVPPPGVWIWGRGKAGGAAPPIYPLPSPCRDGSASATYFCAAESGQEEWIQHQRLPPGQKEFYFRNMQVLGGAGGGCGCCFPARLLHIHPISQHGARTREIVPWKNDPTSSCSC